MKYFRAFRLIGTKAIDEYYKMANEVAAYQNGIYKARHEKPEGDLSKAEAKLNELHENMHETYGMIPHLHYHATPETGFVSELLNSNEFKQRKKKGIVKEVDTKVLEILRDGKKETAYCIPVFKIDTPQSIKEYETLLANWQKIKTQVAQAKENKSPQLSSLLEQLEAFHADLREKYRMNPDSQYVFETLSVGIYMGCSEQQLRNIADEQQQERRKTAADMWKKK